MSPHRSGLDVSRETASRLEAFVSLLEKWNRSINLVSRATLAEVWSRHIADSAQLFPLRPDRAARWVDIGSGGGFPGIVTAILAAEAAPDMETVLVESDARKAAFLATAVRQTGIHARVENHRIESLPPQEADVLSARAFGSLAVLLPLFCLHLRPGGRALFPRGRTHRAELDEVLADWRVSVQKVPSGTDPDAVILCIDGVAHVQPKPGSDR